MSMSPQSLKARLDAAHAKRARGDGGFTLIELLVVVVIIGILVAIAIPLYLNYRQGASNKATQSDVRGAVSAVEQCFSESGNKYPADVAKPATAGTGMALICAPGTNQTANASGNTFLSYTKSSDGKTYTIVGDNGTKTYTYTSSDGKTLETASTP